MACPSAQVARHSARVPRLLNVSLAAHLTFARATALGRPTHATECRSRVERVISRFRTADARIDNPGIQRPLTPSGRCGRLPDVDGGHSECLVRVACCRIVLMKAVVR